MMPNGVLNNQLPPSIMTPPNTPPNINALSLHNLDQSVLPRFKRTLDYESVPVLITSNPRQRTQSSPPPSLPHMFIQEPTVADSFPLFLGNQNPHQLHQHQQQQNHPLPCGAYPPPQQYHYRRYFFLSFLSFFLRLYCCSRTTPENSNQVDGALINQLIS